jgi:hypothetical protein
MSVASLYGPETACKMLGYPGWSWISKPGKRGPAPSKGNPSILPGDYAGIWEISGG